MKVKTELIKNKIIINNSKDASRLYNRSHFGKPLSRNKLELDLIEGVFLQEKDKIKIHQNEKEIIFQNLVKKASKIIKGFEIKYQVYKDLRSRGHAIKQYDEIKHITFSKINLKKESGEDFFVSTFSERDIFDIKKIVNLINKVNIKHKKLWFAIVDEEGDITYYDVSKVNLKGQNKEHIFKKTEATLMKNRVIIFDEKSSNKLFEKEFYGKPFGKGIQLSIVEACYLANRGILNIKTINDKKITKTYIKKLQPDINARIVVFKDLKKQGLIVKTGFKFGTHFRAYSKSPDESHAEYLIHVVPRDFSSIWAEVSRGVRLAHSVNKEFIFAKFTKKKIDYIRLGRLRP